MMVILLIVSLISLAGCERSSFHSYEDMLDETPFFECNPVYVYNINDVYSVVIIGNGNVSSAVSFSAKRELLDTFNIDISSIDSIAKYLGASLADLQNELGAYHTDIGSGLFMPTYISADGYLVCFTIIDGFVMYAGRTDLLSGDATEWYSLEEAE